MEPGIETDEAAIGQGLPQPAGGLDLGPVDGREDGGVDLGADLGAVATIHKDTGAMGENDTEPGRAGEPREPGQALVARSHVFALVGIGTGHEIPIKTLGRKRLAQRGKTRRALFGTGGFGE